MNKKKEIKPKDQHLGGPPPPPFPKKSRKKFVLSPSAMELTTIQTDVLVIGGGFAGNFAAISAVEAGAKVVMAVKGRSGRSGLTPWANSWFAYRESDGVSREDYIKQFTVSGEYLNNMDYVKILIEEAYQRYEDVSAWGAKTGRTHYIQPGTLSRSIEVVGSGDAMREKSVSAGVQLLERVMITSLMKEEGKVGGAIGFHMESGRPYAVLAKATVMCAGPATFKPLGLGYPCSSATGDGDAMAYRAGAEISGKEFNDGHPSRKANPLSEQLPGRPPSALDMGGGPASAPGPVKELDGEHLGMRIQSAYGAHESGLPLDPKYTLPPGVGPKDIPDEMREPLVQEPFWREMAGFSAVGMSNHKAEGVFPQDLHGASNVPGLWAAGDGLSSMQNGAGYAGFGCSCAGSAVQGARAGKAAAEYAAENPTTDLPEEILDNYKNEAMAPLHRKQGYSPAWLTRLLQNVMFPYFVLYVKKKSRLENALEQIMYFQEKFAGKLTAEDPHELRLAHETRNMLLNAEMKLRAGLAREESRGTHYREDFPYRDDENWLAWVKLVEVDGKMAVVKHPVPAAWHPDKSQTYRGKYPHRYPGEDDYLKDK